VPPRVTRDAADPSLAGISSRTSRPHGQASCCQHKKGPANSWIPRRQTDHSGGVAPAVPGITTITSASTATMQRRRRMAQNSFPDGRDSRGLAVSD
jgi:hypothetical protein